MYMRDFGTTALVATPSYALYMCETAKDDKNVTELFYNGIVEKE